MSTRIILRMLAAGWLALAFWGLSIDGATARQSVATVGPDGTSCGFRPENSQGDPIGTALQGGFEEIRIVSLQGVKWAEDLNITRSVTIRGGFETCDDALWGIEGENSLVTGIEPEQGRFLTITPHPSLPTEVLIRRLSITPKCDQQDEFTTLGDGGAISVQGDVRLTVENSTITGLPCYAEQGGLVFLSDGAEFLVGRNSVLQSGKAFNGGGIFCRDSEVYLGPSVTLSRNRAEVPGFDPEDFPDFDPDLWGNGGAIYVDNCDVLVLSRRDTNQNNSSLLFNTAERDGGFAYAINGTRLDVAGGGAGSCQRQRLDSDCDEDLPVRFYRNYADSPALLQTGGDFFGHGGAIYASGQLTNVFLAGVTFDENKAFLGGAVKIDDNANLSIGNQNAVLSSPEGCGAVPCAAFIENSANGRGGAMLLDAAGAVTVWFSEFRGNQASFGSALSLTRHTAKFDMANSIFAFNGSDGLGDFFDSGLIEFSAQEPSTFQANFNGLTYVGNNGTAELFFSQDPQNIEGITVRGSVFSENEVAVEPDTFNGFTGVCVVSDQALTKNFSDSRDLQPNMTLVNPAQRDYRPIDDAPAVDFCTAVQMAAPAIASSRDFLFNERPKLGSVFSADAPFDAGAIELQLVPNDDEIYHDRFEELLPVIIQ